MKRYILEYNPFDKHGTFEVYPYVEASGIASQQVLDTSKSHFTTFFPDTVSFEGMRLSYGAEVGAPAEAHALCDMHGWVGKKPRALVYPISPRFKSLLIPFNIPLVAFYNGTVWWKGAEHEYYVMQLLTKQYQYINVEASTFEKSDHKGNKAGGQTPVKGKTMPELYEKFGADTFTFADAVMQPEFEALDMFHLDLWGILITERLKNAIEASTLTGVAIRECPLDFTIGS
jgi:hypothetical protein